MYEKKQRVEESGMARRCDKAVDAASVLLLNSQTSCRACEGLTLELSLLVKKASIVSGSGTEAVYVIDNIATQIPCTNDKLVSENGLSVGKFV